jgi:hypothetical protein
MFSHPSPDQVHFQKATTIIRKKFDRRGGLETRIYHHFFMICHFDILPGLKARDSHRVAHEKLAHNASAGSCFGDPSRIPRKRCRAGMVRSTGHPGLPIPSQLFICIIFKNLHLQHDQYGPSNAEKQV